MTNKTKDYFFCGIGGSGMMPLALIVAKQGHRVSGSDRSLDQGRTTPKFEWLKSLGMHLFSQDGSGIVSGEQIVVASTAVEETVPDIVRANALGSPRMRRADLLAELLNAAPQGIAVGGTSGKSTVTGMIGWVLHSLGRQPTIMNGAVMKNFASPDAPFASAVVGDSDIFVSEVDESDGSIALYTPKIAVINNLTLDHKSIDELHVLFRDFGNRAAQVIINGDDAECRLLLARNLDLIAQRFGFERDEGSPQFWGDPATISESLDSISFTMTHGPTGTQHQIKLAVPGRHNAANALAAVAASAAIGVEIADAVRALAGYAGLSRRFDVVGERNGVMVIDDFGHNPDKIAATLRTVHAFPGRSLIMFQPHGYGPIKQMGDALVEMFAAEMRADDQLILPDPVYFGGTVDKSRGSDWLVDGVCKAGRIAQHIPDRAACGDRLVELAQPGDRILIMGARDDTLTAFARDILARV